MKVHYNYNINYKYIGSIFVMRPGSLSFMRVYLLPIYFETVIWSAGLF